jgi:hypothetical protein
MGSTTTAIAAGIGELQPGFLERQLEIVPVAILGYPSSSRALAIRDNGMFRLEAFQIALARS